MRRLLAAFGVVVCVATAGWGAGKDVLTRVVVCSPTLAHLATANINRQDLTVQNVGTLHVNVGRAIVGLPSSHAGAFAGLTLHVGASIEFQNYQGGLDCKTQPGTGSTAVEVLETLQ